MTPVSYGYETTSKARFGCVPANIDWPGNVGVSGDWSKPIVNPATLALTFALVALVLAIYYALVSKKQKKDVCPFVADPHEECYCFDLQSINVKQAIFYCQQNHERCEIYNEKTKSL